MQQSALKKFSISASVGILLVSGCARSVAVERVKMDDVQLARAQVLDEIQEAEKFRKTTKGNKDLRRQTRLLYSYFGRG